MAGTPEIKLIPFARFVRRTLDAAHDRGLTDQDIAERTGVPKTTFYRWARGGFRRLPNIDSVIRFCKALDANPHEAMVALGLVTSRAPTEPNPPLSPELRVILRYLARPDVTNEDKAAVRAVLRMLADQAQRPHRRNHDRDDDSEAG